MQQLGSLILFLAFYSCQSASPTEVPDDWAIFKVKHNRTYSAFEEKIRRDIFQSNVNYISTHNKQADAGEHLYWLRVNKFADLTPSEYLHLQLGYRVSSRLNITSNSTYSSMDWPIGEQVDWRTANIVNPVREQSTCASDWAMVAISVIESQVALVTGSLPTLSVQQLIDCSSDYENNGCGGGATENALKYIKDTGGVDSDQLYPQTAHRQTCKFDRQEAISRITGFVTVQRDEQDRSLKDALANVGPIASVVDASHITFKFYSHGIYDAKKCAKDSANHAIVLIGYGREGELNYWLLQNSWGTDWGENGTMRLSRDGENNCGIANYATYPLV